MTNRLPTPTAKLPVSKPVEETEIDRMARELVETAKASGEYLSFRRAKRELQANATKEAAIARIAEVTGLSPDELSEANSPEDVPLILARKLQEERTARQQLVEKLESDEEKYSISPGTSPGYDWADDEDDIGALQKIARGSHNSSQRQQARVELLKKAANPSAVRRKTRV